MVYDGGLSITEKADRRCPRQKVGPRQRLINWRMLREGIAPGLNFLSLLSQKYRRNQEMRTKGLGYILSVAVAFTLAFGVAGNVSAIETDCNGITIAWDASGVANLIEIESSNYSECNISYIGKAPIGSSITLNIEIPLEIGYQYRVIAVQYKDNYSGTAGYVLKDATCMANACPGTLQVSATYQNAVNFPPSMGQIRILAHRWTIIGRIERSTLIDIFVDGSTPPPTPSADSQMGGPSDNDFTDYDTGGAGKAQCPGLPVYSVNTSLLNLVVEDTDLAWQSYGHDVNLRRVWNLAPNTTGMFGNGWSFSYESTLKVLSGTAATVALGSGQTLTYNLSTTQGEGTGTITENYSYSDNSVKPTLTGFISEATGTGYYTLEDKNSKLASRYDYVSIDSTTGKKIYRLTSIKDRNGNTLALTYDVNGRLTKLTDASNRETTFSYDAGNHCTRISTFNSQTATFEYDAAGNLIRNVDLAGNVITYAYDTNRRITSMTAAGKTTGFTYSTDVNNNRRVSSVTDAMGKVTNYELLAAGGTKVTEPGGGIRTYASSSGLTTSVTDPLNKSTSTAFNNNWLPSATTDKQGRITSYEYDANGNLTKLTDSAGKITTFEYDTNWNLTKKTDPLGNIWTFTYNASNNLTAATSPLGRTTTFTVDNKGLVTQVTKPDGSSAASTYDSNGNIIGITDPLNKTTSYGFDAYGLELVSITDPKGNTTGFSYDPNRLLTSMTYPDNNKDQYSYACNALMSATDGGGNTTTLERDNLLHVTKITNPLAKSSSSVYNSDGFITSTTDPLGRSAALGYDAAHRIASITDPLGKTILFSRNADGSPSSITNARGNATTMSYDNRGFLLSISDPLGNVTTTNSYDNLGRLSSVTNARGKTVSAFYDNDGRNTEIKHDGVTVATYGWNSAGQLTAVTDSTGVKTFTRDAAGQVTNIHYPDGLGLAITYDDAGNVSSISYPGVLVVSYSYDSRNRTSGVSFGVSSVALNYSSTGRLAAETRSNSVQSTYGYDAAGQLTGLSHEKGATVIADLTYTRDDAGLVIGESGILPLNPANTSSTVTATYNNADGVLTWGGDNYTYDTDGNLTAITGATTFSAAYDNQNRPTSITLGGTTTTYSYDGLGNRVKAQTADVTRNFHHDPWGRLLFETNASGLVTANYIYAGNRLVASGTTAGGYVFYHQDKTGNTLALTDSSGTVVGAFAYSPDGAVLNETGSVSTPFTYVGAYGVMSEGNDLYFMKNRYYDAATGRFIQRDPIGFAGGQTNLYAYVGNNPVESIDLEGTSWLQSIRDLLGIKTDTDKILAAKDAQLAQINKMGALRAAELGFITADYEARGKGAVDIGARSTRLIREVGKNTGLTAINAIVGGNIVTGAVMSQGVDQLDKPNNNQTTASQTVPRLPQGNSDIVRLIKERVKCEQRAREKVAEELSKSWWLW